MSNDTDRDIGQSDNEAHDLPTEFLDDTSDTHAVMFGFWRGVRSLNPKPKREESQKEPHYFLFGYVLGWIVKLAVLVLLGREYLIGGGAL